MARASDTTGSSTGLSNGVGSWLYSCALGVMGSVSNLCECCGVDGRTSSMGVGYSFSMPKPTTPVASRRGVAGVPAIADVPPTSVVLCFSARRSNLRRRRSLSAFAFFSRLRLSLSRISRSAPASSVSARSSILLDLLRCLSSRLLRGLRSLRNSGFSLYTFGEVRSP